MYRTHFEEKFASSEHIHIGEEVTMYLTLPNGLQLSFGEITALSGDFYGVPEHPIIDQGEKSENIARGRRERFMAAYSTLAHAIYEDIKKEVDKILEIMQEERNAVDAALKDGKPPSEALENLGNTLSEKWDTLTGGIWILGKPIKFGRYMNIALSNYDHFVPSVKDAYLVGHELAIEKARDASKGKTSEEKDRILQEAYSIDAFACHFLTDSFASGHMRTPRRELPDQVTPSKVGHLLTKYMHDEDNKYGLRVTNKRGDKWIAYGDGMLLNKESKRNLEIVSAAFQASVKQVEEAFLHPERTPSSSQVTDYIPFVDVDAKNNYPMFQVKDGQVVRRTDLENLSDPTTISTWTGIGTVVKLQTYKPHGSVIQV